MNYFDLLFSPKGTIKPQPFAIVVVAVYAINIIAGSALDGQFVMRAGMWPYITLRLLLTWIWFAAHVKRLRDAGKGFAAAATIAFLYLAGVLLMINLMGASSSALTPSTDPKEPSPSLFGVIFAVLFINTLFTGDVTLIIGLLLLFIALPLIFSLIAVIYSFVTGARASITHDSPTLPPSSSPSPVRQTRSPFT